MILLLILIILPIGFLVGIFYLINWITKSFSKEVRTIIVLVVFSILIASICFFLFHSGASNFKTAYITPKQKGFMVTVRGKRAYMVHDPISIFTNSTYIDSAVFDIPRSEGIINGHEIIMRQDGYSDTSKLGTISILQGNMKIDLYNDYLGEDKKFHREEEYWNGDYQLEWRLSIGMEIINWNGDINEQKTLKGFKPFRG